MQEDKIIEEFRNKFGDFNGRVCLSDGKSFYGQAHMIHLEDFILQKLKEAREEARYQLIKEIEEQVKKVVEATESDIDFAKEHRYVCQTKGHHEALVLQILLKT